MKKLVSLLTLCALMLGTLCVFASGEAEGQVLYVYNWGEYISDGSEDSMDVVKEFEDKYGIEVKYDYYQTNEELYAKLSSGSSYDVVIPSDYMIQRLHEENLLQEIDASKLTNYSNIDPKYLGKYFDQDNKYSVPYAVGMIGIVYNTKMVDPADVEAKSWNLLWNTDYAANKLINFNNPRDAFGVAMLALGMDVNTTNEADWQRAFEYLKEQKCMYLMDEVFNKMENGKAAAAAYYAGDCITMMDINPDLAFYYPVEGTNIFIDSMCIPKSAKNPDAAHLFIDFMLSTDVATANANYISYASPNTTVLTNPDYAYPQGSDGYEILYNTPDSYEADPDTKMQYYHRLDDTTQNLMNSLWNDLIIANSKLSTAAIVAICAIAAAAVFGVGYFIYTSQKKKKAAAAYAEKMKAQASENK